MLIYFIKRKVSLYQRTGRYDTVTSPKGSCGMQLLQISIAFRYSIRSNLLSLFLETFTGAVPMDDYRCFSAVYVPYSKLNLKVCMI